MTDAAANELCEQVTEALLARPGQLVIWGVSRATLGLAADLDRLGLADQVAGFVDHRDEQCARRIGRWTVALAGS